MVTRKGNAQHAINVLKVGYQRKVQQIDKNTLKVIKEFENITIACKENNISSNHISAVCNEKNLKNKTSYGFIWKYV